MTCLRDEVLMRTNYKIIVRAFLYFSLFYGVSLWIIFSIFSHDVLKAFKAGLLGGVAFAFIMSTYLSLGLFLFRNRLLFYSNIEKQLSKFDIGRVDFDGIAGDTTRGRIKYGGLFLTDGSVVFIPHRFAVNPTPIKLSLDKIVNVKKVGINILKVFSGGLGTRLLIEAKDDAKYEFRVWEPDKWIKEINARIKHS
jgi:hypothetical protein